MTSSVQPGNETSATTPGPNSVPTENVELSVQTELLQLAYRASPELALTACRQLSADLDDRLQRIVGLLRREGWTWQAIADATNMGTEHAAHARFTEAAALDHIDDRDG